MIGLNWKEFEFAAFWITLPPVDLSLSHDINKYTYVSLPLVCAHTESTETEAFYFNNKKIEEVPTVLVDCSLLFLNHFDYYLEFF